MEGEINTPHDERLYTVLQTLVTSGAKSVLDLGCGTGTLLRGLARVPQFELVVGMDSCGASQRCYQCDINGRVPGFR